MMIKQFEDIEVWKEARKLVNTVYALTHKDSFKRDFGLRDQIERSAVSCMSNIREGFDSDTKQQFIQMLSYTRRSASEVQSELYVALDRGYISKEEFDVAYGEAQAVRKLANGFIRYLRTRQPANPPTRTPVHSHTRTPAYSNTRTLALTVLCFIALAFCFLPAARANNLAVSTVTLSGQNGVKMAAGDTVAYIKFNVSQENAWRFSSSFHDAAWVFVKYSMDDGVTWNHATISNADMSATTGTALSFSIPEDYKGAFLYRAAEGSGALSTTGVKLSWNISADGVNPDPAVTTKVLLKVFALEMVSIPQGAFYVGSGGTESGSFTNGSWSSGATVPLLISSEGAITIGQSTGNLWGTSSTGNNAIGPTGTLDATFPKGYKAFYIMKYELTQGQYRDFLNTLTRVQQAARSTAPASGTSVTNTYVMSGSTTLSNRNGIRCAATIPDTTPITFYCDLNGNGTPNEAVDGEYLAFNYSSWPDMMAYADWAALRPMTELEYEKAARGTATPVADEYAWGSTTITKVTSAGLTNSGAANEIAANGANCAYGSNSGSTGPLRTGFASTAASTTRQASGAGFYGVMDLTGNEGERMVTVGSAYGRTFDGAHGDGVLNASGGFDVATWSDRSTAYGIRGGNFLGDAAAGGALRVSDRSGALSSNTTRSPYNGGRFVRTTP